MIFIANFFMHFSHRFFIPIKFVWSLSWLERQKSDFNVLFHVNALDVQMLTLSLRSDNISSELKILFAICTADSYLASFYVFIRSYSQIHIIILFGSYLFTL